MEISYLTKIRKLCCIGLLLGLSFALSACNDDDDSSSTTTPTKLNCAP